MYYTSAIITWGIPEDVHTSSLNCWRWQLDCLAGTEGPGWTSWACSGPAGWQLAPLIWRPHRPRAPGPARQNIGRGDSEPWKKTWRWAGDGDEAGGLTSPQCLEIYLKTKFMLNASWPWPWSRFVQTETLVFIQASTKCSLFSLPIKISDNSWWCAASSEWTESWWKILTFFFSCLFLAVIVTVLVTDGHKSSLSVGYKQSVLIVGQMYHPIQTVIEKVSLCYKDTYLNTCLKCYMHPTY